MRTIFFSLLLILLLAVSAADGADDWTNRNPSAPPSARYSHNMSYIGGGDYPPLLVGLSSFTATALDNQVTIQWRTEMELDNVGFAVYRSESKDGKYTKIGFVHAAEDSEATNDYQCPPSSRSR